MKWIRTLWNTPAVAVIFASTLVAVMGVSLISPALPAVQDAWNISESQASLLLSAFTLPGIFLTLPIGLLADRIGRKPVLIPALSVFGLSGGAIIVVSDFTLILVLRAIQGAASSAVVMLTVTLLGDLFTGEQRRVLIGTNAAILAVGAAGYPLLGGALATLAWWAPFVCFLLALLVAIPGITLLEEPNRDGINSNSSIREFLTGPTSMTPFVVLYLAIFGIFVILYGAQLTAVPFLLANEYQLSSAGIGLLVGLPAVTMGMTALQGDRVLQVFTSFQSIALGFVSYGIGLAVVAITDSIYVVAGALLLFGLGQGLAEPITDTALNERAPDEFRGSIMSIRTSVLRLGTTIGPPLSVGAASVIGYRRTLLISGSGALIIGASWFMTRRF
ncbi:MFS transporter [Halobacterium jilantaiense]|uniref:Predicted arabinose efflux permease, MFS family n=1 Tax=Halobacterium jilantaiense TaxID=355548 RepID=A0A1I0R2Z1_9EURY|nr:MFS transporter [Halobacterium jilantaiense]SEW34809.1 Predicted arabinose efflux permease, MFS family [Halobacterium jilantaiense]